MGPALDHSVMQLLEHYLLGYFNVWITGLVGERRVKFELQVLRAFHMTILIPKFPEHFLSSFPTQECLPLSFSEPHPHLVAATFDPI